MRELVVGVVACVVLFGGGLSGQARQPARAVVVFVDDLRIGLASTPVLRSQLNEAVNLLFKSGRIVGLVTDTQPGVEVPPTGNAALLTRAIHRVTGGGLTRRDRLAFGTELGAEIDRRSIAAETALSNSAAAFRLEAMIYVSEVPRPANGLPVRVAITTPTGVESAARQLIQWQSMPDPGPIYGVVTVQR